MSGTTRLQEKRKQGVVYARKLLIERERSKEREKSLRCDAKELVSSEERGQEVGLRNKRRECNDLVPSVDISHNHFCIPS